MKTLLKAKIRAKIEVRFQELVKKKLYKLLLLPNKSVCI